MYKTMIALSVLALSALGWQGGEHEPPHFLKEESMTIEYTPARDEAVVIVAAESEVGIGNVEVIAPSGQAVFRLRSTHASELPLQGFIVETRESTADELMANYREGMYYLHGRAFDGREVRGRALFSHLLLPEPAVVYPAEGDEGVPVTFTATWVPDSQAMEYQVVLEQDENDGLFVRLPAGTSSFQVPAGVLRPGLETQLEIAVVAENGNRTLTEVVFTTL